MGALENEINQFSAEVNALYGHYIDSTLGFGVLSERFTVMQQSSPVYASDPDPDSHTLHFGKGDPNEPTSYVQHSVPIAEFKRRNAPGGSNHVRAGQLHIILIYAFWESRYRASIADALGIKADDLKVPIMGDLRRLRNDIVHCVAVVQRETAAKLEVLTQFREGDTVRFSDADVWGMMQHIGTALRDLTAGAKP
ncbi:MAG: hypothetical protein ABSC08_03410 [Bryobacteraceae bacterium]|jgi:hypothetical protein